MGKTPQYEAGQTLRITAKGCAAAIDLDNRGWCCRFLKQLARAIGMTPLGGPFVERLNLKDQPELNGVSAVLIIQESHLAIHTWPFHLAARIVIDTCGEPPNVGAVAQWCRRKLRARQVDVATVVLTQVATEMQGTDEEEKALVNQAGS